MDGIFSLTARKRKVLVRQFREGITPEALRALILLLAAHGLTYLVMQSLLGVSSRTIAGTKRRWDEGGITALATTRPARTKLLAAWLVTITTWVMEKTPRDFGLSRSRWSCATIAIVLVQEEGLSASLETIRRGLHESRLAWNRPRPVVGLKDPDYRRKLRNIQQRLRRMKPDETAVFQDEMDLHLNPKLGSMWMRIGQQATVATPGNNEKRHLAGSIHWRTGQVFVSPPGTSRNSDLFLAHLDDLRRRLRRYRRIHVICDNAKFHTSHAVQAYLKRHPRIVLVLIPKYAPETNPTERIWWHLHETITRNHRCQSIQELVDQTFDWLAEHGRFKIDTSRYCSPTKP
jgi:putative transposase